MKRLLIALLFTAASAIAAENSGVHINTVKTEALASPLFQNEEGDDTIQISGMELDKPGSKEWLRISAEYETRAEWTDRLTLEFYVLLQRPNRSPTLFKGVVQYVDIPRDRKHLAEMYMHFNSYARHAGRGKIRAAVIAKVAGKTVAIDKQNSLDDKWWETMPTHPVELLSRLQTPFAIVNTDRYEAQVPVGGK